MSNSFEKMNSLIGDTTNMSYSEYVGKMAEASIKISKEPDIKEMISLSRVAGLLVYEKFFSNGIDAFSVKRGINFNEIDNLSNAANYILENKNNSEADLKIKVHYNLEVYKVPVLSNESAFDDGVKYKVFRTKKKFNTRNGIKNGIKKLKTTTTNPDYYIMAMEFTLIEKYDNEGNLNKTVRIVVDEEAMLKVFAISYKNGIEKVMDELVKKLNEADLKNEIALLKAKKPA